MIEQLSDRNLLVIYKIAKTRLRPFFADPKAMIELRNEVQRRQECANLTH